MKTSSGYVDYGLARSIMGFALLGRYAAYLAIGYRRFGKAYRSRIKEQAFFLECLIFQRSEDLKYNTVEACNYLRITVFCILQFTYLRESEIVLRPLFLFYSVCQAYYLGRKLFAFS
jgi:hypothetical protein